MEVRLKPWDPWVEGGAEVSELFSGTGWGGGWELQWPAPEKEGGRWGRKVEVVELDLGLLQQDWE